MNPVKIALVGNRHDHTVSNFGAMKAHPETFSIVGVSDIDRSYDCRPYEGFREYSLNDLLAMDDLEAVVIEAGKEYEIIYAQKFADKGIPVFLDKPGSADFPRFEKFMTTMKERNLPVGFGYMYRFNPLVMKTKELIASGALGDIYSVEAQMSIRHDINKRKWLGRYKGGMLFYLGCHLIDMVCQFQGFPMNIIPLSCPTGSDGLDSDDFGCAIFKYQNGVSFIKTCASEYNGSQRRQLVICGTKGTVEINPPEMSAGGGLMSSKAKITLSSMNPPMWSDGAEEMICAPYHRYYPMLEHFAREVRGELPMVMSYEYETELMWTIVHACGAENTVFSN